MATTLHLPSDVPFTKHLPNLTWLIIAQSTFNYQKKMMEGVVNNAIKPQLLSNNMIKYA